MSNVCEELKKMFAEVYKINGPLQIQIDQTQFGKSLNVNAINSCEEKVIRNWKGDDIGKGLNIVFGTQENENYELKFQYKRL